MTKEAYNELKSKYPLLCKAATYCGENEDGHEYQTDCTANVECFIHGDRDKARSMAMYDTANFWLKHGDAAERKEAKKFLNP